MSAFPGHSVNSLEIKIYAHFEVEKPITCTSLFTLYGIVGFAFTIQMWDTDCKKKMLYSEMKRTNASSIFIEDKTCFPR